MKIDAFLEPGLACDISYDVFECVTNKVAEVSTNWFQSAFYLNDRFTTLILIGSSAGRSDDDAKSLLRNLLI